MVEPDRNNFPNLLQQVKSYLKLSADNAYPYAQHLHRLDRPVSGIVLFTKKREHLKNLSEQFADRSVKKIYTALTSQKPIELTGKLDQWHRKENKKAILVEEYTPFAEKIKLSYNVTGGSPYYRWDIELYTGKFHQIRAQLAGLECPIIGDFLYGSDVLFKENAIALHAQKLIIQHPVTEKEIEFIAEENFDFCV